MFPLALVDAVRRFVIAHIIHGASSVKLFVFDVTEIKSVFIRNNFLHYVLPFSFVRSVVFHQCLVVRFGRALHDCHKDLLPCVIAVGKK